MKVSLDKKAIAYLDKKNVSEITVSLIGCASWGVGEPQPTVLLEAPNATEINDFDKYEVENKTVYVLCTIHARNNELNVKYSKILFIEKLIVEGIVF